MTHGKGSKASVNPVHSAATLGDLPARRQPPTMSIGKRYRNPKETSFSKCQSTSAITAIKIAAHSRIVARLP